MFGIKTLYKLLKKQGLIQEKTFMYEPSSEYHTGPIDIRKLDTKVNLLMDYFDLELVKIKEHYELQTKQKERG